MAQSTKIQAACFLILLIANLASSSILQQLVRQPEALQPRPRTEARTEARTDGTLLIPKRTRRDSHFPFCTFCCYCCGNSDCGFCCKT
ncbi:hepcidin [Mesocricetus auratus]|uniref:Hepcidin n=1 Tax=Mesocricetus auratus TaxID=10036 RepID=A0A1U7QYN9_MESAU|nr:hepcidin [Mesocricetus auratus]